MASTEAFINPLVLRWARERSFPTVKAAALALKIPESKLDEWEHGITRPTLRRAETLATRLHVPFGFLFLSEPPTLELTLPDLRTLDGTSPDDFSPEFHDVLNDSLRKQEWYRSYLISEGSRPLPFIGRFSLDSSAVTIAAEIDDTLSLSIEVRRNADNWEEFLKSFVIKAEEAGVLVLRNSVVGNNTHRPLNVEEFRGFVISDEFAPLIFLNGADAQSAQIFTLAHELAHLWIGESGISNPDFRKRASEQNHPIERICDSIAAQTLVPEQNFNAGWQEGLPLERNIALLTRHFKVSRIVILRRAYELTRIGEEEYWDYYNQLSGRGVARGGGDFYRNLLVRNSRTFTTTVVETVLQGRTDDSTGAKLLNVQIPTFRQLISELIGAPIP